MQFKKIFGIHVLLLLASTITQPLSAALSPYQPAQKLHKVRIDVRGNALRYGINFYSNPSHTCEVPVEGTLQQSMVFTENLIKGYISVPVGATIYFKVTSGERDPKDRQVLSTGSFVIDARVIKLIYSEEGFEKQEGLKVTEKSVLEITELPDLS